MRPPPRAGCGTWKPWWRPSRSGNGDGRCSCWRCTGAVARRRLCAPSSGPAPPSAELGLEPGPELVADGARRQSPDRQITLPPGSGSDELGPAGRATSPGRRRSWSGHVTELQERLAELALRRLVTLTGPGGVGKTRLATEIAWSLVDDFPGGVWMVELAPVAGPAAVVAAVASTLSVQPKSGMTMERVDRRVVAGPTAFCCSSTTANTSSVRSRRLVEAIVAGCPTVTVLTTSREPLGIPGEWVHVVPSLDPATEGVELFCDRAVAADEAFTPSDDDRAAITADLRDAGRDAAGHRAGRGPHPLVDPGRSAVPSRRPVPAAAEERSRRPGTPSDPAGHRRLVLPAARRRRATALRPALGVRRRVRPRCRRGGMRPRVRASPTSPSMLDSLVAKSMVIAAGAGTASATACWRHCASTARNAFTTERRQTGIRDRHLQSLHRCRARALTSSVGRPSPTGRPHDLRRRVGQPASRPATGRSPPPTVDRADTLVAATGPHAWCRLNHEHGDVGPRGAGPRHRRPAPQPDHLWMGGILGVRLR